MLSAANMRALIIALFISGCSGAVVQPSPEVDAGFVIVPVFPPKPETVCYSEGSLYKETFVSQKGNTCKDILPMNLISNEDGSLGKNNCTVTVDGCQVTSKDCSTFVQDFYCSIYEQITYSEDGSSGNGIRNIICYPYACNPQGICLPLPSSTFRCLGVYDVSLVRL